MKLKVFLCLILFCLLFSTVALGNESNNNFVLFIMDQVSLDEISEVNTPNLDYLIEQGAVALMNSRSNGSLSSPDTYLTIGAGRRANTNLDANYTFNIGTKFKGKNVKKIYQALTGINIDTDEVDIVNIRLPEIIKENLAGDYNAQPGTLGETLKKSGMKVAVIGNSDYLGQDLDYQFGREAAMIGIDKKGMIYLGDVGQKTLIATDQHPFGFFTNQKYLMGKFEEFSAQAELIIIESGDTARVEAFRDSLLSQRYHKLKNLALRRTDDLLGKLIAEVNFQEEQLMVIIPTPAYVARSKGQRLTLNILAGKDIKDGLLTSPTTKRKGIITNLDIAPTILKFLGIDENSTQFLGDAIESVKMELPLIKVKRLDNQITKTFNWRPFLIKGFILLQIMVLILAALVILFRDRVTFFFKKLLEYFLLVLLFIPLFLLLSNFFLALNLYLATGLFIIFSLVLVYILKRITVHELGPILIISNFISLLLIFDLWTGAELIKTSVLGYSPIIGARFYGIGNEFMGLLLGFILIGVVGLFDRFSNLNDRLDYILLSTFILVVLSIGHPRLGANFGGLVTSLVAFAFTYVLIKEYQFSFRNLMIIATLIIVLVGSLVFYDALSSQKESTHIGKTILLLKNGGFKEVLSIIYRKLRINLKLLRWTIWTKVILAFIFILAILFKYPVGVVNKIIDDYFYLRYGFIGVICASIITMLVNDSGVVAAATLLLPAVVTFVYLVIQRSDI